MTDDKIADAMDRLEAAKEAEDKRRRRNGWIAGLMAFALVLCLLGVAMIYTLRLSSDVADARAAQRSFESRSQLNQSSIAALEEANKRLAEQGKATIPLPSPNGNNTLDINAIAAAAAALVLTELPPGERGPQGPAGPSGSSGAPGTDGTDGTNGATGATGATGPQGPPGTSITGPQGPQGDPGPSGAPGTNGTSGTNGQNGANGTNGVNGQPGTSIVTAALDDQCVLLITTSTGEVFKLGRVCGVDGAPGATGPTGPVGATGATGPSGPSGAPGSQGATGERGDRGVNGRGVQSVVCDDQTNQFVFTYSDGTTANVGQCRPTGQAAPAPITVTVTTTATPSTVPSSVEPSN